MKSYLIDVDKQEIREVDTTDYKDFNKYVGCNTGTIPIIFSNEDSLWIDNEGLLKSNMKGFTFVFDEDGTQWKFAGNGLLIGSGTEGENADVQMTIERLKEQIVKWLSVEDIDKYRNKVGM
jgi:hypothetical protein